MTRTDRPPPQTDFAVVGGGILGLAVARELARRHPDASICLLEAENRLAAHQTSHSSGVVHAGVYYEPGSLRARLCVEGSAALHDYCQVNDIPVEVNGKLIVATSEGEVPRLDELERRGLANGVAGLARIDGSDIAGIEPNAVGLAALHSPNTAVVDFSRVAESFAKDFEAAGGTIHLEAAVIAVSGPSGPAGDGGGSRVGADDDADTGTGTDGGGSGGLTLKTKAGRTTAGVTIFCGGLQSDRLAKLCGGSAEPRIVPVRGGYLKVRPGREGLVRGNVYPVPDPDLPFLGAHLTRGFGGSLLIGPTAMVVGARDAYRATMVRPRDLRDTATWPGTWRLIGRHRRATVNEIRNSFSSRALVKDAQRLVPGLTREDVEPGPSGIRAQALGRDGNLIEDFLIEKTEGAVHVRNAPSPAATSSLSLAKLICDQTV